MRPSRKQHHLYFDVPFSNQGAQQFLSLPDRTALIVLSLQDERGCVDVGHVVDRRERAIAITHLVQFATRQGR